MIFYSNVYYLVKIDFNFIKKYKIYHKVYETTYIYHFILYINIMLIVLAII